MDLQIRPWSRSSGPVIGLHGQGFPNPIRSRRPDLEAPAGDHGWRIHKHVPVPLPLPDVESIGPDALAFYVPFHLYRKDWVSTYVIQE